MSASFFRELVHFSHFFHPAGHGTFFSGHIRRNGAVHDDFVWVYDCGSRRWKQLDHLVAQFVTRMAPKGFIDMVCLSHFDSDHVNGVEALLEKVRIGTLVLPYLSVEARLALACTISGSEPAAHQLAVMIVDPSRYLVERGLRERVERVILVQGGPAPDLEEAQGFAEDPEPRSPIRDRKDIHLEIGVSTRPLRSEEVGHQEDRWIEVVAHDQRWSLGGLYELTFYNRALPDDQASKSGATLRDVADELGQLITKYGLCSSSAPANGWVKELRKLYNYHFGGSASKRNIISLCALGRPLISGSVSSCRKFKRHQLAQGCEDLLIRHSKSAIVMTGDAQLDPLELDRLSRHFGSRRWNGVGVMQVPHHGSLRSWRIGLSAMCVHSDSVICASPSHHHPHVNVMQDLQGRHPVLASDTKAVAFDYHVTTAVAPKALKVAFRELVADA